MTDAELIKHLWTHKTQDHPDFADEELMIERGEGVYVWTRDGKKLIDAFAGLSVVNVGHGRTEIADEVITGFGRTGKWFGVQHENVVPDLMSVAKGITSGYVPLSASIARARIADAFGENSSEENVHPNTYCGHPVACAAALANLDIIERENLVSNAELMGARLHSAIEKLVGDLPIVGEVRSRGLMIGVDMVDPVHRDKPLARELVSSLNTRAWKKGAIPWAKGSIFRLAPPLCITPAEADELASIVGETIGELQDELSRSRRARSGAALSS